MTNHKTPIIILVNPQLGENIGMCMRAMLNFNLQHLRLVNPRPNWSKQAAIDTAAGAAQIIMPHMQTYPSTTAATADLHYLIATTARTRDLTVPHITPKQAAQTLRQKITATENCGILFGGEQSGLDNDDITKAHAILRFETNAEFTSINLAQTVMLLAYEFSATETENTTTESSEPPASLGEVDFLCRRLDEALWQNGFYRSPEMRPHVKRNLNAMFRRMQASPQDIQTWHGIIKSLMRKPVA